MAIFVTHEAIHDVNNVEIGPIEWRVAVDAQGQCLALPMVFGREQQDAGRARDALECAGLSNPKTLQQAGKPVVLATMLEGLTW